jgi:predicted transcriptional regulator
MKNTGRGFANVASRVGVYLPSSARVKWAPSKQKDNFYIKKPAMQIRGFADFIERLKGDSDEMWARYGKESCFKTEEEYNSFIQGRDKVTFVRLKNLMELNQPKTGEEISLALGYLRGFRGKYVDQETAETLIT